MIKSISEIPENKKRQKNLKTESMIKNLINKILGDPNEKILKKIRPLVSQINILAEEYSKIFRDQNDILAKTSEFKNRIATGESLENILPEAFALVKVSCEHLKDRRWLVRGHEIIWDMVPYDVQLIGGIVLHQGNIAEMKTGEGKTLVSTLPIYLNALTGKGIFVVTVNDYLAQRDAEWMGGLFNYLGLSVGVTTNEMNHLEKKQAYNCDITYGTNNEFGFDYLRDNMANDPEQVVQRNLHFAIIDEVDSILIDEARTPLIISGPAAESTEKYAKYNTLINFLEEKKHFEVDEKSKNAHLTEEGIVKMEELLGVENIYTDAGFNEVHHLEQALRAKACYKNEIDYIVKDGEVIIIDEFTGRLMQGRRYSQGLHQAIEAKEGVEIKRESKTLATITFQNYFRLFEKLAGMTGTAETEAEEFYQIYGLETVMIPTHRKIQRIDRTDAIYKNTRGKFSAIVEKIKEIHAKGQPILVGTISVEKSELLSNLLQKEKIPHKVLNAKHHEKEAEIVAQAGIKGAVTIATNMAGRGTDIKPSEESKELGGLFVIGTERHESRRIDNQLRGRSGRQGDPGVSQFFVSMEDDLMRLFGGERMKNMMDALKMPEDMPIENTLISGSIESAQKKVEGRNFDIRKHLVEYDDVMNIHREIIYKKRREFMFKEEQKEEIFKIMTELVSNIVENHTANRPVEEWDLQKIIEAINSIYHTSEDLFTREKLLECQTAEEIIKKCIEFLENGYENREKSLNDPRLMRKIEKMVYLRSSDALWMEHIDEMSKLRENVAFSGYAQKDPLVEYKSQGYNRFQELLSAIKYNTINNLFKIDLQNLIAQKNNQQKEKSEPENKSEKSMPLDPGKIGRNDSCPCGSGKKFKKCHGNKI